MDKNMNKILKNIFLLLKFLKIYASTGNTKITKRLLSENISIKKKKGLIQLPDIGININPNKHIYILKGIHDLCSLRQNADAKFELIDNDKIIANINTCRFYIESQEDIFVLNEVFAQHIYNIYIPCKSIVVDIGMNIADTTLYFACNEKIEKIYAYEPFKYTYNIAIKNIGLNPKLSKKIEAYNFGISDKRQDIVCAFAPAYKVGAGIATKLNGKKNVVKETITLLPAANEITKAKKAFPEHKLIIKIDCEGMEFEIIKSLSNKNLLSQIDIILLEWHIKSPKVIIDTLLKAGFTIYNKNNFKDVVGMLYAFKI